MPEPYPPLIEPLDPNAVAPAEEKIPVEIEPFEAKSPGVYGSETTPK